jgi:hypothetical protein
MDERLLLSSRFYLSDLTWHETSLDDYIAKAAISLTQGSIKELNSLA